MLFLLQDENLLFYSVGLEGANDAMRYPFGGQPLVGPTPSCDDPML